MMLLYPYFLWGIIQGSIMAILSNVTNGGQGWNSILLLPIDPFGQFWYLYDLFFMSILYYGLSKLFNNTKLVVLLSVILFFITPLMTGWEWARIFHHFLFLVLGSEFFTYENWISKRKWYILAILSALSYLVFYIKIGILEFLSYGLLGTAVSLWISRMIGQNSVLEYLGKKSLPIYLWHILAISGLRIILTRVFGFTNILGLITVLTLAGTVFPLIVDYVVNRLRCNRLFYGK